MQSQILNKNQMKTKIAVDYDLMLKNVIKSKKKVNCYVCNDCGKVTKTFNVDDGVTPMYLTCEHCGALAVSTMFNDIAPEQEPTQEWYRPTLSQVMKMEKGVKDNILLGGLLVRPIKPKTLQKWELTSLGVEQKKEFTSMDEVLDDSEFKRILQEQLESLLKKHNSGHYKRGPLERIHDYGMWNVKSFISEYRLIERAESSKPSIIRLYIQGVVLNSARLTLQHYGI